MRSKVKYMEQGNHVTRYLPSGVVFRSTYEMDETSHIISIKSHLKTDIGRLVKEELELGITEKEYKVLNGSDSLVEFLKGEEVRYGYNEGVLIRLVSKLNEAKDHKTILLYKDLDIVLSEVLTSTPHSLVSLGYIKREHDIRKNPNLVLFYEDRAHIIEKLVYDSEEQYIVKTHKISLLKYRFKEDTSEGINKIMKGIDSFLVVTK